MYIDLEEVEWKREFCGQIQARWIQPFAHGNPRDDYAPIIAPKSTPYQLMTDFRIICYIGIEPGFLVVRPGLECKTVEELIEYAKKNPGKLIAGTSAGVQPPTA